MGIGEIQSELDDLKKTIEDLLLTLGDKDKIYNIIKDELIFVKDNLPLKEEQKFLEN